MGQLFSSGKSHKPPVLEPEKIIPLEAQPEPTTRRRKYRGRSEAILTGELIPETKKKHLFGGP